MSFNSDSFFQTEPLLCDWGRQFSSPGRYSVPEVMSGDRLSGPQPGPQHALAPHARSASMPHDKMEHKANWVHDVGDLQPCWTIWGSPPRTSVPAAHQGLGHVSPLQLPAPPSASATPIAVSAPSPPLNTSRYSPVLSGAVPAATSSFWFGSSLAGNAAVGGAVPNWKAPKVDSVAHHALVSPPLSPQSSWETGDVSGKLAPLSPSKAEDLDRDSLLDSYFHQREHQLNSLYDPVPGVGELDGVIVPITTPLFLVKFKNGRTDVYTVSEKTIFPIAIGNLVLVDADRGRDIGKVFAVNIPVEQAAYIKWKQHHERQQVLSQCATKDAGAPLSACSPKHILRVAQPGEVRQFAAKRTEEQKAVRMCNQKVHDRNLDMTIVDAEYQWDHRKLTFFYQANQRVDFRDLVRELFRMYKTRIWMCAVNN